MRVSWVSPPSTASTQPTPLYTIHYTQPDSELTRSYLGQGLVCWVMQPPKTSYRLAGRHIFLGAERNSAGLTPLYSSPHHTIATINVCGCAHFKSNAHACRLSAEESKCCANTALPPHASFNTPILQHTPKGARCEEHCVTNPPQLHAMPCYQASGAPCNLLSQMTQ